MNNPFIKHPIAIAAYKPRLGKEAALLEIVREHHSILRSQGLVTDRKPVAMRAGDGTIIEVFEWKSSQAIDEAHRNPVVLTMWERFNAASEYPGLASLSECAGPFPTFEAVDL